LARNACLRTIAEDAIIAVGINAALGTFIACFNADFVCLAWRRAVLALARIAGLFAVAEQFVIAVGISGALGGNACIDLFHADFAYIALGP
jgi:hypothetical protein